MESIHSWFSMNLNCWSGEVAGKPEDQGQGHEEAYEEHDIAPPPDGLFVLARYEKQENHADERCEEHNAENVGVEEVHRLSLRAVDSQQLTVHSSVAKSCEAHLRTLVPVYKIQNQMPITARGL